MRHRTLLITAALTVLAGACQRQDRAAEPVADNGADAGISYQEQLTLMPAGVRNAVFIRAIRDAGLECQHVERSTSAPDYRGMPVWNARCQGGGNWTIVIGDNGIAQILNANETALLDSDQSGNGSGR